MIKTLVRTALALPLAGALAASAADDTLQVRPSAIAGSWYPGDATALAAEVDRRLADAPAHELAGDPRVRLLLVPHAGHRFSGDTAAAAFRLVQGRRFSRVMVLAPAHHARGYRGLSIAGVSHYETPLGAVPLDLAAVDRLRGHFLVGSAPRLHAREHSIEIELPFLQRTLAPGWKLLPILVGDMQPADYAQAAALLRPLAGDDTLVVVSSDFSHYGPRYGYTPFPAGDDVASRLKTLDFGAFAYIAARDGPGFLAYQGETGVTICGYRPIAIALEMLPEEARVSRLAYTTSGELTGDWTNSVSYLAAAVTSDAPLSAAPPVRAAADASWSPTDLAYLHRLAKASLQAAVSRDAHYQAQRDTLAAAAPQTLTKDGAAFVTLKKNGHLRGCVGTIAAHEPLYRSVMGNAVNAALYDRRFLPVTDGELGQLEVEVSLLSPPRPIASYRDIELGRHGIILSLNGRRAVFLPQVAPEQGWTLDETLSHLSRKAGLPEDAWKNGARLEVFTATVYP